MIPSQSYIRVNTIFYFLLIMSVVKCVMVDSSLKSRRRRILNFISYTTPEIIREEGYPVEIHHPVTEDGYILEMHRIPHGKNQHAGTKRPVVLIQHGLMSSSSFWVLNTPDKALAYILADAGYDVWMNNIRGNVYTRKHQNMSCTDDNFWEFSFDEMGRYDMPATIDYVLNATSQQRLYYVGFSMGTTVFLTMAHYKPEYQKKIIGMVAIAPSAFLIFHNDMKHIIKQAIFYQILIYGSSGREMFPNCMIGQGNTVCSAPMTGGIFQTFMGSDPNNFTKEYVPAILSHYPAGTSLRTLMHYQQLVLTARFAPFSFGKERNKKMYGSPKPAPYKLENVVTPMAIFYSEMDTIVPPAGVRILLSKLKNVVHVTHLDNFSHEDFGSAVLAVEKVYKPMLKMLPLFNKLKIHRSLLD